MMLYKEESKGLDAREDIYKMAARCHVTRRRAQRDCPSTPLPTIIIHPLNDTRTKADGIEIRTPLK